MRSGNFDWIWVVVFAVAWLLPLLAKRRSAGEGDRPPAVPKPRPKRGPQARQEAKPPTDVFGGRQSAADRLRVLLDQIRRAAQPPAPAPGAPPPIPETVSASPQPIRESASAPRPAPKLPVPSPSTITEPEPTPASFWAAALRDKQSLRRLVIAAEIIGPPKGV